LVDNGADVDVKNNEGFTPLMVVASSLQSRLLEKMVKKSKNIDVVDDNGRSALIKSAMCGLKENVEILLQNGANKDITDLTGWSAKDYIKLMGTTGTIVDKIMKKKFGRD
jgi:ankyrin repeat protein